MVDRTPYRQQKTAILTHDPSSFLVIVFWCCTVFCCLHSVLVHHYIPLLSWSSCVSVAVFCCLYSVLFTIIFPLLSWSSCFGVAQSFVVYMVFSPPLFSPSFLVIVFWCKDWPKPKHDDQERRGK
jgi:hypothetical protein